MNIYHLSIYSAERKVWLISLFFGTAALYASRAVMPLCIVAISKEMNWDKMQSVCCMKYIRVFNK